MGSVHAGKPDKGLAELHAPGVLSYIDKENNQAVDSDRDNPYGNPVVTECLAVV